MKQEIFNIDGEFSKLVEFESILIDIGKSNKKIPRIEDDIIKEYEMKSRQDSDSSETDYEYQNNTFQNGDSNYIMGIYDQDYVTEDEYALDIEMTFDRIIILYHKLINSIFVGDLSKNDIYLNELETLISEDGIMDHIFSFDIDPNDILNKIINFLSIIESDIHYHSDKIICNKSVIKELNDELLFILSKNPDLIHEKLDSQLFEELIAKIFTKFKMKTELTKKTRDGGIDIVAFEDTHYTKSKYIIECKHWAPNNKVGIEVVQRLWGIKDTVRATKAFLVTSSFFSKEALKWSKQHAWNLELKDYSDIVMWLNLFWAKL